MTPAQNEAPAVAAIDTTAITKTLTRFEALAHEVAIAQQEHGDATYDYRDPAGNKRCRSALYALRRIKGAIETARKGAKQPLLEAGREVDRQAKLLEGQISALIDPHQLQLDRIEQEEQERIARHREVLNQLDIYKCNALDATKSRADFEALIRCVEETDIGGLEEFAEAGRNHKADALEALMSALDRTVKLERQAAELERLRAEAAEREREAQRVAGHRARLNRIVELRNEVHAPYCSTPDGVRDLIGVLRALDLSGLEEFTQEAEEARASALEYLGDCMVRVTRVAEDEKRRSDELDRLRAQAAAPSSAAAVLPQPPVPAALPLGASPSIAERLQTASESVRANRTVRQAFIDDLAHRLQGKTREQVAEEIAYEKLHRCVRVDWTAWQFVCKTVPETIHGPLG